MQGFIFNFKILSVAKTNLKFLYSERQILAPLKQ